MSYLDCLSLAIGGNVSLRFLSVRARMVLLALLSLVSIVGLSAVFLSAGQFVRELQQRENEYAMRAELGRNASSLLLQLEAMANGVLNARDRSAFDEFLLLSSAFQSEIRRIDQDRQVRAADAIGPDAERYIDELQTSFEAREKLGLTHEVGLEGQLRRSVHAVESRLDEFGDYELTAKMLMMRRHEKDFMMRLEPGYLSAHSERDAEFRDILAQRPYSVAVKQELQRLLTQYRDGFEAWAEGRLELKAAMENAELRHGRLVTKLTRYTDTAEADVAMLKDRQSDTLGTVQILVWGGVIAFAFICLTLTWLIGDSIAKRIRKVSWDMLGLCANRTTELEAFHCNSPDEIEHLENVLGFFRQSLIESDRLNEEIRYHRDHLTEEVAARTAELKEKTDKLEKALSHEKELSKLQNQFVSVVSHEFRTPLTIIDAMARRVSRKADSMSFDDIRERMENIRGATQRLSQLVERTLESSRLQNGEMEFSPDILRIDRLVEDIVSRHREIAPGFTFELSFSNIPETMIGDEQLLDHVITNLVSNAIKYSADRPQVQISLSGAARHVELRVKDHGVGIPRDELPMIAQRFFRASTSSGIKGTGIGLNLVAKLVGIHKGTMSIDSIEGKWTEIVICLPLDCRNTGGILPLPARGVGIQVAVG